MQTRALNNESPLRKKRRHNDLTYVARLVHYQVQDTRIVQMRLLNRSRCKRTPTASTDKRTACSCMFEIKRETNDRLRDNI